MEHEPITTRETEDSRDSISEVDVFNLETLSPKQIVALVNVIGASRANSPKASVETVDHPEANAASKVLDLLDSSLEKLAERDLNKGMDAYLALAGDNNAWARSTAIHRLAPQLLRQFVGNRTSQEEILEAWFPILNDADEFVAEMATERLSDLTWADWLDEPTARYIDSKLPVTFRRDTRPEGQL